MSAAVATAVEMLAIEPMSTRALAMFDALEQAAGAQGVEVHRTAVYRGSSPWLMLWGYGGANRAETMVRHVASGGHALMWDLAYWQRETKVRVSIDAPHPSAWVMRRAWPGDRCLADRVPVGSFWQPDGLIVVAGIGVKSTAHYGPSTVSAWESDMAAACLARWPKRPIVYRAKTPRSPAPAWASSVSHGSSPIDGLLRGASLLITWHSNVAVDAIRMGIPVVCRDGAAAAVCPSELPETLAPLPVDVRDRFLGNLAWFQWDPSEASACWRWLQEMLS